MKTIRLITLLAFASLLSTSSFVRAEDAAPAAKPAKAECGCPTGTDGKVCGVDKACCCKSKKAACPDSKKDDAAKTDDVKK